MSASMPLRFRVKVDDPVGRWKAGEIGEELPNDFAVKYAHKLDFGSAPSELFGAPFLAGRVFYFYADEVALLPCLQGQSDCVGPYGSSPSGFGTCCEVCAEHHDANPRPDCPCAECKPPVWEKARDAGLDPDLVDVLRLFLEQGAKAVSKAHGGLWEARQLAKRIVSRLAQVAPDDPAVHEARTQVETLVAEYRAEVRRDFEAMVAKVGTLPTTLLAVPGTWTFQPEECDNEYLAGFIEGRYDSMNASDDPDDPVVAKEVEQARAELHRRGVTVPERKAQ